MAVWVSSLPVRRSHFLVWKWPFWKQNKLSPFGWEFWHDRKWQKFSLISLAMWLPNKLLFVAVALVVPNEIWLPLLQTVVCDVVALRVTQKYRREPEQNEIVFQRSARKRLALSCFSFFYHKLLVVVLVTWVFGDGFWWLMLMIAIQAVIGIVENPVVWFFNNEVAWGDLTIRQVPRALVCYLRNELRHPWRARLEETETA